MRFGLLKNTAIDRTKSELTLKCFGTRGAYFHHKVLVLRDMNYGGEKLLDLKSVRMRHLEYRRAPVLTSSGSPLNTLRQRSGRLNGYYGRRVKSYERKSGDEFELWLACKNLIDYFSLRLRAIRSV